MHIVGPWLQGGRDNLKHISHGIIADNSGSLIPGISKMRTAWHFLKADAGMGEERSSYEQSIAFCDASEMPLRP